MCCFVAPAPSFFDRLLGRTLHVDKTRIYARRLPSGEQALAYAMSLATAHATAMVLPLPTDAAAGEAALSFVDLEGHAGFFETLERCFEPRLPADASRAMPQGASMRLEVHRVGSFIASFSPTRADLARLDPAFRLSEDVLAALPIAADSGFAVFQLEKGKHTIHPMAFTFRSRDPERLFFPTVHAHDGRVPQRARFDHALYFQSHAEPRAAHAIERAPHVPAERYYARPSLVDGSAPLFKVRLRGELPNRDTWIEA